jgi:hypothetical protein
MLPYLASLEAWSCKREWNGRVVPCSVADNVTQVQLIPFRLACVALIRSAWLRATLLDRAFSVLRLYTFRSEHPSVRWALEIEALYPVRGAEKSICKRGW